VASVCAEAWLAEWEYAKGELDEAEYTARMAPLERRLCHACRDEHDSLTPTRRTA